MLTLSFGWLLNGGRCAAIVWFYPSPYGSADTTVAIGVLTQAMAALRAADRPTDVASTRVSQSAVPASMSPVSKQARADCVEAEHLETKRKRINGAAFPSLPPWQSAP